jgi:Sulfotransferase family
VSGGPSPLGLPARKLNQLRRQRRLRRAAGRLYGGAADPPAPFIGGATRSGTTLLRLMLDAHPEVAIPSETHFVPDMISRCVEGPVDASELAGIATAHPRWGDFGIDAAEYTERVRGLEPLTAAEAVRAFYRLYASKQGKARWGDKTPGYIRKTQPIQRVLPEARFIHMIRDGRDVALSVMPLGFGPSTVTEAAELWVKRVSTGRRQASSANHYTEVTYEELIADTEGTLRRVCGFLDLGFDPAMLAYHERASDRLAEKARDLAKEGGHTHPAEARIASHALASEAPRQDRIGRWRREMNAADVAEYERVAGPLLVELGYELSG